MNMYGPWGEKRIWELDVRKCPKFLISIDSFFCKEYYIEYFYVVIVLSSH